MPWTYRHASREWRAILDDAKDQMHLSSDNMAYTAIDAVFQVFRVRLTAAQGLAFASILPTVPRAIFVADWDVTSEPRPFLDRNSLVAEAKAVRPHHNLTPDNAIEATAFALRRAVPVREFERVMKSLPQEARDFWDLPGVPPEDLAPRIV
ncbi:DUF2267 domain-containing protein [Marivita sp. XM-24bin2]|jgi:uncharacterized protein (DUF2267 family)|uniref:DUF2267 domain-containing protein n=1 Tax=unclassified Marivita TaxID=2632480 RepID=UPI00341FA3B2